MLNTFTTALKYYYHSTIPYRMKSFRITALQRGLLENLIKRGKPVNIKVIAAILNWKPPEGLQMDFPTLGAEAYDIWDKILPTSLCKHLFKNQVQQIKLEP